MTSYSFTLFLCAALLYQTDSLPRWSWGKFADFESPLTENKQLKDCVNGQCLQAWKCPGGEYVLEEPTTCSKRRGGPWICCIKHSKDDTMKLSENSEVTSSLFKARLFETTDNSSSIHVSTTPDWVSVEVNVQPTKESNSTFQETLGEYKQNEKIVNWGKTYVNSPKHSYEKDSFGDAAYNNAYKPYIWSKGSTSDPLNRLTEDKWLNPVDLRNRYPSETSYERGSDKSWDYNHNYHGTKKTTKNWIVSATPSSKWSSPKSSWNSDHTSNKITSSWKSKTTASSWVRPTSATLDKVSNPKSSTSISVQHSWTKSTKSLYGWNYSSESYGSTKTREIGTTSKPRTKSTTQNWRSTTSFEKSNKTRSTVNAWVKPSKDSWNRDSYSNTEKKNTNIHSNNPTTGKYTTKHSARSPSTTKAMPRTTAAFTSRQSINKRLTTPKSSSTRSTVSTQKPWGVHFENIEKSRNSLRTPSSASRSATNKNTLTTPLPNVNSQRCGIRVSSRGTPRRSKRQSSSEEIVVYAGSSETGRDRSPFQRIVGGKEVDPFSWPWMAALYRVSESGGNRFLSAGSLINRNFVLTAAHVFTPDDLRSASFVVMLGTHTAREAVAEYVVMNVLRHPGYQQRYYYNDIALLRLERPVEINEYVMPVCLPSPSLPLVKDEDLEGKRVTVMGWGDQSYGGKTSRVLKEASFPIAPRKSCNESYFRVASNRFPRGITSNMLCAGDPNGGKDACQGDSGGPLTTDENGRHTQVGIVSFGFKCGDRDYPGVYTKVASYLSWIAENARCDEYSDYPNYYSR